MIHGVVAAGQAYAEPRVALAPGAFDGPSINDPGIGSAATSGDVLVTQTPLA